MEEIEVKILEINVGDIKQKLKDLGAKEIFDGEVAASYLDFPDKDLVNKGKLLRLRKKEKVVELTFKEKISKEDAKIMKEYEVHVNDFDSMKKILANLGLEEYKTAQKHRISYVLGDVHFELDTFPDVPTFLEIEAPTLERVKEYVKKLGFSIEETKPWSGGDVLRYYGKL